MHLQAMLKEFYHGRRVLVTGHTGFKGSWLSMWLHMLGAEVMGVALDPPGTPSMFGSLRLHELMDSRHTDINDYPALEKTLRQFAPEVVIHMAALSLVRPSYKNPLATLNTNILGTARVLEACRHCPATRAVIIVTSDKCYRNNEWVWGYRENDPMGGHDPYSASKGCAELVTASYIKSFFPPGEYGQSHQTAVASARAGNAIGGGDWGLDRLIPDCFRALHQGEAIHIRYPSAVRPWQHVLECLSGYLMLGARLCQEGPRYGCGWNFAPMDMGDIWPVGKVVEHICRLWGNGRVVTDQGAQPHEAHMLCLDCTKARIDLGWLPRYRVARALRETVAWYKAWSEDPSPQRMRAVTLGQIQTYMDAVKTEED
ncbi:CDP-glucose 4,6-dehydratase [uncultured Desulfovibrio sp.]|uniref:CDP-glucose 4,6-dehydratase n=1 Tax=uncultured Desulfovibrio sp. TaxID=167968 RepID=UPI0026183D0D|nr:CDP-glucose 4,6-dehydratase [uncultured Desulfovibrio sp.]